MDDIASMITQFLDSEEGVAQLKAVSQALGLGDIPIPSPQPKQGESGGNDFAANGTAQQGMPQIDINTLMMMQRAISMMGQEDKNTELLRALKPHFSSERAKKVDDAIRIIQLMRLLPLAKELGLLDRFKGGAK